MRSLIGGCVAKKRDTSWARKGLAIIMCELLTRAGVGVNRAAVPTSSFRSAEANASGSPVRAELSSSASYSRVREIAIWMTIAAKGRRAIPSIARG